jgi:hypothetical protein
MFSRFLRKAFRRVDRSRIAHHQKRASRPCYVEHLEDRVVPSTLDAIKTTFAPGETAVLHLVGLATGETVAIRVTRTDGGTGTPQASPTWLATDGGAGDFDHTADGQITFNYLVPSDATNATFQITATGTVSRSTAQITLQSDGSSGDILDNGPAPPQTTTTVSSSAPTAASGQAVTFAATVASDRAVNEGDVQFLVDGFAFGDPVPVVNGQATSGAISSLTVASHTVTAVYADGASAGSDTSAGPVGQADGDAAGFDASEGSLTQLVTGNAVQDFTVAWVEVQPQDVAPGQFATVTAGAFQAGETVDFQITNLTNGHSYAPFSVTDGGSNDLDGVTDGHVQTTWQVPADALDCQLQITATGETSGLTAQATFADAQLATTTIVSPSANPSTYGNSVAFTATVTASSTVNTGTVQFQVDSVNVGTPVSVSAIGRATFVTATLTAGPHTITANYTDGTSFANSSGSVSQTVNQRTLLITANPANKTEGNTLTFAGTEFTTASTVNTRGLVNGNTVTSVTLTSAGAAAATEDGSYAIVPSAAVGAGLSNYAITYVPGTLTVLEPAIVVTATPLVPINEGDLSAPVEVATFMHANGVELPTHFTATVNWGVAGHTADPGTVTQDGSGIYHVTAARPVFAEQGTFTPVVTVSDNDTGANIAQNFAGLNTFDIRALNGGGFFIPPDQGSAVGPNHYVEAVNLAIAVYNKDGTIAVPRTKIGTFLANAGVPGLGNNLSDPRIVYDQASDRWFFVVITTESNSNSIVVAVSQTSDPTGAWKATKFVANTIPNNFADFPTIAVDANALYVASNNFLNSATFDGVSLTSIPKADLLNPAGPVVGNRTHFENLTGGGTSGTTPFTLAPVTSFDSRDHGVILATDGFFPATVLHSYSVLNPGSNVATLSADSPIAVPTYWTNQNAHEPNSTQTLESGDFRIGQNNVYQVGNVIWAAQSVLTSSATGIGAYDAIRWYEIDATTDTLLQSGTISDPHHDYLYPAIAANAAGDVVISFSATGDSTTTDFPGAWYVAGTTTGGVTTFGAPTDLRNGSSNYGIFQSGSPPRNRWGDFGAVSVDPNNPNAFWIANETAIPGVSTLIFNALWGTQVSELVFGNTASASGSLTVSDPPINGASATLPVVKTGQTSAAVEVATFTHANGVEPIGDFTATVDWDIAGHHADPGTVTQDGTGTYHVTATRPVFNAGTYTVAVGISEDNTSTTVIDSQEVDKDDTTTTAAASPATSSFGQSVTFSATVTANPPGSGIPTGTVDFFDTSTNNDLGPATLSGGSASLSTSTLSVGSHSILVSYLGDTNFLPSSTTVTVSVLSSVLVLNPALGGSLSVSGNGVLQFPGTVTVDSSAAAALSITGDSQLTAGSVQVVGGASVTGNGVVSPAAITGVAVLPDPLAGLPVPAGGASMAAIALSSGTMTINPGVYPSIALSGSGSLILNPGVYVIAGGGFSVSGSASVTVASGFNAATGRGVLIYNAGSNFPATGGNFGGISLTGSGTVYLTTPDQGAYAGITIFQARDNVRALSLSGKGMALLGGGAIYAPAALLAVSGQAGVQDALVVNRLQINGNGSSTLVADGSTSTDNNVGELAAGNLALYINDPAGYLTQDELARINDAVSAWDALLAPQSVAITEVNDPAQANLVLDVSTTSACGGMAQGVLGCYGSGQIVIIQGWNFYAGADASAIGANQYDFETLIFHELGHSLGLGGSSDTNSVMFESLPTGVARRTPTVADLNIGDLDGRPDALRAAGNWTAVIPAAASPIASPVATAAGLPAAEVSLAFLSDASPVHAAAPWSASGLSADRFATAAGSERAEPFHTGVPYRSNTSASFLASGSATFESELPADDTTPADATEALLIDTIFADWCTSAHGPGGHSRAEDMAPRFPAAYTAEPASYGAGISGLGSEALEAFAAWGVTDPRSEEAFPETPGRAYAGVVRSGSTLSAITAASGVAALTERGRPLPRRARARRNNISVSIDEATGRMI